MKDIKWEEIKEAEKAGEEIGLELYDILEEASIYGRELDNVIEKNIEEVLKREKLLPRNYSVVIPMGALRWTCEDDTCYYTADFEVFDETGNRVVATGTATGTMIPIDKDKMEVIDMRVWLPPENAKKLKVEKLKDLYCTETGRGTRGSIFVCDTPEGDIIFKVKKIDAYKYSVLSEHPLGKYKTLFYASNRGELKRKLEEWLKHLLKEMYEE